MGALLRLVTSAPAMLTYTIRLRSTGETRTVIGEAALSQALTVAAPAKGAIVIRDIPEKSYTRGGKVYPREARIGHHAEIVPGKSIRLFGIETNRTAGPVNYDRTWKIGDACIVGGYNMTYFGTIAAIGPASVTTTSDAHGRQRFDIAGFSRQNAAEDYAAHCDRNASWSD